MWDSFQLVWPITPLHLLASAFTNPFFPLLPPPATGTNYLLPLHPQTLLLLLLPAHYFSLIPLDLIAGGACSTASLFLLVDNFMVLCVFGVVLNFGTWDLVMLLWKESVCVRCWKLRSDEVLGAKRIVAGELQAWNGLGI